MPLKRWAVLARNHDVFRQWAKRMSQDFEGVYRQSDATVAFKDGTVAMYMPSEDALRGLLVEATVRL